MGMKSITKQAYEEFFIGGSILDVQGDTETVVLGTSTVAAEDKDGTDVTSALLDATTKALDSDDTGDYTDNVLAIRVRAGEAAASPYKVTFYIITSEGNKFEIDMEVNVEEV